MVKFSTLIYDSPICNVYLTSLRYDEMPDARYSQHGYLEGIWNIQLYRGVESVSTNQRFVNGFPPYRELALTKFRNLIKTLITGVSFELKSRIESDLIQ